MLAKTPKKSRAIRRVKIMRLPPKPRVRPPRDESDFYPTPRPVINALLDVEQFPGTIWEPACGAGHICKALIAYGWEVELATDLFDKGGYGEPGINFMKSTHMVDHIVTNPPYAIAEAFVAHALENARSKVAMLLPLAFLESVIRKEFFNSHEPARVYVFRDRVTLYSFNHPNQSDYASGGKTAMAWFVWDKSHRGRPTIDWITADPNAVGKQPSGPLVEKLKNAGRPL